MEVSIQPWETPNPTECFCVWRLREHSEIVALTIEECMIFFPYIFSFMDLDGLLLQRQILAVCHSTDCGLYKQ